MTPDARKERRPDLPKQTRTPSQYADTAQNGYKHIIALDAQKATINPKGALTHHLTAAQVLAERTADTMALTRDELEHAFFKCGHQNTPYWLEEYAPYMTYSDLYYFTVQTYIVAPYGSVPTRWITDLKYIRPADYLKGLDPALADTDPITVYRGGAEGDRKKAKLSISWTTDPITAIFFYSRIKGTTPRLWKGRIRKEKILATTNDRGEHEILQYNNVGYIEEIHITDAQKEAALKEWKRQADIWNKGGAQP